MEDIVFGRPGRVHLIGIGGIAMSALARWFLARKWTVSGSDIVPSQLTLALRKEGAKVVIGQKKGALPRNTGLVIYSQAVPPENPELSEAILRGVVALSYPQAIGRLVARYRTVAAAGAHGKSTTTALSALIFMKAKKDPTVIIGTKLRELGGKNFRRGRLPAGQAGGGYLVLEADEYGRAFLNYAPEVAIVTNIDREHLDTYGDLAGVKKAFLAFIARVRPGGTAVLNADNKNLLSLRARIAGIARKNRVKVVWYSLRSSAAKKIRRVIRIPGDHNVSNAVGAYHAARAEGISEKTILAAIGTYRGAWRRFEHRGAFRPKGIPSPALVYDDYAHHPTEILATLKAFKEKFPDRDLICVFQPHQAKRLQALFQEFQAAFRPADTVVFLPLYKVPGRDETIDRRFDSETLARAMQKKHPGRGIFYLADPKHLRAALATLTTVPASCGFKRPKPVRPAVIVMMGAGDIADYTQWLIR